MIASVDATQDWIEKRTLEENTDEAFGSVGERSGVVVSLQVF